MIESPVMCFREHVFIVVKTETCWQLQTRKSKRKRGSDDCWKIRHNNARAAFFVQSVVTHRSDMLERAGDRAAVPLMARSRGT